MCGIFGIMSTNGKPLTKEARLKFLAMGLQTMTRGTDASGVFNSNLRFAKQAGPFCFLTATRGYRRVVNDPTAKYLSGHCRLATQGSPDDNRNNHPLFNDKKEFLVVHNGVITKSDPTRVDSYEIVKALAAIEDTDLYSKTKNVKVSGSGTFVAGNKEKLTFHVFPHATTSGLYFAVIKGADAIAFASTYSIIGCTYGEADELLENYVFECKVGKATVPKCKKDYGYQHTITHYGKPPSTNSPHLTKRERKRLRKLKRISEQYMSAVVDAVVEKEVDNAIKNEKDDDGVEKEPDASPQDVNPCTDRINLSMCQEEQDEITDDEEDDGLSPLEKAELYKGAKPKFYCVIEDGKQKAIFFDNATPTPNKGEIPPRTNPPVDPYYDNRFSP